MSAVRMANHAIHAMQGGARQEFIDEYIDSMIDELLGRY